MRIDRLIDRIRYRILDQRGVTMIIALGVMLVTSLLLVGAYAAANGDIHNSHVNAAQKQAYYAALAGIQEYEYQLQANPNFWQKCEEPASNTVGGEQRYEVKPLVASSAPEGSKCSTVSPFTTMIESKGALANTFRIESIGCAGASGLVSCEGQKRSIVATRKLIATFQVTGFLDFIYFTNYETEDPKLYSASENKLAKECAGKYREQWGLLEKLSCHTIKFTTGDSVQGPMHTNDSTRVEGTPSFGRSGHNPADAVEINGDTYPSKLCPASGGPTYYTVTKCYNDKGPTLIPPESDSSLESYVESANRFEGVTYLKLDGTANTIAVRRFKLVGGITKEFKETIEWPKNGLIYVERNEEEGCNYTYEPGNSDNSTETTEEKGCGNVYVEGTYSKSLTVAGENDLIIKGSLVPSNIKEGEEPSGTAVLGLIASEYVRVYHPCEGGKNGEGSLENPWIYAGSLSTNHSFIVDNFACGKQLGKLNDYGAIAQNYRGPVGTSGGTGYLKNYKYDNRLATDEPPYFLAPLKAGWRVIRETAPNPG